MQVRLRPISFCSRWTISLSWNLIMIERIRLEAVEFMPAQLEPGVLYVSEKYRTAAHLCACGCGEKVRTQLGDLGWRLTKWRSGPTLYPSIGNWQKIGRAHV